MSGAIDRVIRAAEANASGNSDCIAILGACAELRADTERMRKALERIAHELAAWELLLLWGGTPENIHDFIKSQQERIRAAEGIERKLAAVTAERDALKAEKQH